MYLDMKKQKHLPVGAKMIARAIKNID